MDLSAEYRVVFQDGFVKTKAKTFIESSAASKLVSVLRFLDRISLHEFNYPGADAKGYDETAQSFLKLLNKAAYNGYIDIDNIYCLEEFVGVDLSDIFEFDGIIRAPIRDVIEDVIQLGSAGPISGKYYADSHHYDEQFEANTFLLGCRLTDQPHGVYTLKPL
ncbi:MAG: hypothetical protein AAF549_04510 [Pseudomonadota bacterium]